MQVLKMEQNQINEKWPEDLDDLIIHFVELEEPIGFSYIDEDLEHKVQAKMEELSIKDITVSQSEDFEDTQYADSCYLLPVKVEYKNGETRILYVKKATYGEPDYMLIWEDSDPELYEDYHDRVEAFYNNCDF